MNLLLVFFLVTFLWQNAHAKYGASCEIESNFMGKCVPSLWCKDNSSRNSCGTFDKMTHVCCANNQFRYNKKSIEELKSLECGVHDKATKIQNGKEVSKWNRPWMAVLKYKSSEINPNIFRCGGTLITHHHVLTAAHCVKGFEYELEQVRLGAHNLLKKNVCKKKSGRKKQECFTAIDYNVAKIFIHENFSILSKTNDIALLRLSKNVKFNVYISPICLPITSSLQTKIPDQFKITGWGLTEKGERSNVLLIADVTHVDLVNCSKLLQRDLISSQICAFGNESDSCQGDSGGPLQAGRKYFDTKVVVQFGIISMGDNCLGTANRPGVYTRVSNYIQWITDKMTIN